MSEAGDVLRSLHGEVSCPVCVLEIDGMETYIHTDDTGFVNPLLSVLARTYNAVPCGCPLTKDQAERLRTQLKAMGAESSGL